MKNVQDVLADERQERTATREINRKSYAQLSKAIDGLAKGLAGSPKPQPGPTAKINKINNAGKVVDYT